MPQGVEDLVACCNDKLGILAQIFGLKVYIHRRQRSYFHLLRFLYCFPESLVFQQDTMLLKFFSRYLQFDSFVWRIIKRAEFNSKQLRLSEPDRQDSQRGFHAVSIKRDFYQSLFCQSFFCVSEREQARGFLQKFLSISSCSMLYLNNNFSRSHFFCWSCACNVIHIAWQD